jgi:hypothetical protein
MQFVVWIETIIAGESVAVQRAAVVERQCLANGPNKAGSDSARRASDPHRH